MDKKEIQFALTTEIKAIVTWSENTIKTPEMEQFEKEIQEIANILNKDLANILLNEVKKFRSVNFGEKKIVL